MTREESELFTVVIPTRERIDTLTKALQTVTSQRHPGLRIIICDNDSADGTREAIAAISDPRLTYVNPGRRLSMSHNWEYALGHVHPDSWVTLIGDDDGLLPGAIEHVLAVARRTGARAIRSNVCAYSWPSLTQQSFGRLGVPVLRGVETRSTAAWMERVLQGRCGYSELPMLYNGGFVHMSALLELKQRSGGHLYRSSIPDIYSAFALSSILESYAYVRSPLAINGLSAHSTGMSLRAAARGTSSGKLFSSEENIPLHSAIPRSEDGSVLVGQGLVYESFLQSAHLRSAGPHTSQVEQLEVALALDPSPKSEQWGRAFADLHGLDADAASRAAKRRRLRLRLAGLPSLMSRVTHTFALGSPDLPIPDVYAACIAAGTIRDMAPSQTHIIARHARRAVGRALGQ